MMVAVAANGHVRAVGSVLAGGTFNDPENARIIWLMSGGLLLLGVLVAVGTVLWWRSSRVEHPALGPLEVMGSRSWWKGDYSSRRRSLEAARPTGAEPAGASAPMTSEPVDLEAAALASPSHFDDLLEFPTSAAVAAEADAEVELGSGDAGSDASVATADADAEVEDIESSAAEPAEVEPAEVTDVEVADVEVADVEAAEAAIVEAAEPEPVLDEVLLGDADDTSVSAEVPRPIDPLLRLNSGE